MFDLNNVLNVLRTTRPVFHSEADFQHALAWQIHQQYPEYSIRLEYPLSLGQSEHLDILAFGNGSSLAIELKYKTKQLFISVDEEIFWLKDQSAQDCGRYDFLLDIERLEQFVSKYPNCVGHAILLTNDSSYWDPPRGALTVDADFRIHDGRLINGILSWGQKASKGTTKGRERAITIRGTYRLLWKDYCVLKSNYNVKGYRRFRYLMVTITRHHLTR